MADTEKAHLRGQALEWLRADLALLRNRTDSKTAVARALRAEKQDAVFVTVRNPNGVAGMPPNEHEAWAKQWELVDETLRSVTGRGAPEEPGH